MVRRLGKPWTEFPSGMNLCVSDYQKYLDRARKPRSVKRLLSRKEADLVEDTFPVFLRAYYTVTPFLVPLCATLPQHPDGTIAIFCRIDYRTRSMRIIPYGYLKLWFFVNTEAGGRSSGRETIGAGKLPCSLCQKCWHKWELMSCAYTHSIGPGSKIDHAKI